MTDQSAVRIQAMEAAVRSHRALGIEMIRLWMRRCSVKLLPDTRRNRREHEQLKGRMLALAYGAPMPLLLAGPK